MDPLLGEMAENTGRRLHNYFILSNFKDLWICLILSMLKISYHLSTVAISLWHMLIILSSVNFQLFSCHTSPVEQLLYLSIPEIPSVGLSFAPSVGLLCLLQGICY